MGSGIYRPVWVSLESEDYDRIVALTFVVNREHPHYAGPMPSERMADIMAGAKGSYGLCRDYLAGTIEEMRKLDVSDSDLEELLSRVDAIEGRAE